MLSLTERNDSWQNMLTGLGSGRDKSTYNHLSPNDRLPPEYLEHLKEALVKSRIFGAAFIYVGADDGQLQDQALSIGRVKSVRFLNALTIKDLSHHSHYADPNIERYGQCETYRLNTSKSSQTSFIHESRLIPFFGTSSLNANHFPHSVLQRIYPVLQQFHTDFCLWAK